MKKANGLVKFLIYFFSTFLLLALILFLNGTCFDRNNYTDYQNSDWMKSLPDNAKLLNIAIPGSHDAGTKGVLWLAETQSYSIKDQLRFGVRYFDIRVNKTDKGYPMYHSIFNGDDFRNALYDIKEFLKDHPSETLILDFQHFKNGSKADVFDILQSELAEENLVLVNDTEKSDLEFIHQLTLQEVRGKCIVFFGETNEDPSDRVFLRNNDDCSLANMSMDSYYLGDYHKAGFTALTTKAHPIYYALLLDKKNSSEKTNQNGLFVLQCQLTDGKFLFGPWAMEKGMEKKMSDYIESLSNATLSDYDLTINDINVVLRDFLTPQKCEEIIKLNEKKDF